MRKSVLISTTEHLLSVFYSYGIDNALIEIDNLEVPILDGSGAPFVELIREAGTQTSRRHRRYLKIVKPVQVETNGKKVSLSPQTGLNSPAISISITRRWVSRAWILRFRRRSMPGKLLRPARLGSNMSWNK